MQAHIALLFLFWMLWRKNQAYDPHHGNRHQEQKETIELEAGASPSGAREADGNKVASLDWTTQDELRHLSARSSLSGKGKISKT